MSSKEIRESLKIFEENKTLNIGTSIVQILDMAARGSNNPPKDPYANEKYINPISSMAKDRLTSEEITMLDRLLRKLKS